MASSRPERAGEAGITIEFRTRDTESEATDKAYWTRLDALVPFLATILGLCPNATVLFDFGRIYLRPIDLAAFAIKPEPDPAP